MEDLISIIIPVYNVEKYLKECIQSVIIQTYTNLEIILINDGSTDNSGKICDEYKKIDTRIKVIHKENGGVSSARNCGLANATGKYISFIDSDDYIEENYCERLIKTIKYENVDCVLCKYNKAYEKNVLFDNIEENHVINSTVYMLNILNVQNGYGFCTMKLWHRSAIENIKFNEKISVGEDALFCIETCKNINNVYILNEKLYNYRFNENSLVRKYDEKYAEKYLQSMRAAKDYIEKEYNNPEIIKKINNYVVYHVLLIAVNYCFNNKNNLNFIKQIKKLKKICNIPEFKKSIKECNYDGFSITRKITIFTLKYRLYLITMLIGKVRQFQFRNR